MSTAASWNCPSCDRRVPPRVDVCRCGTPRATSSPAQAPVTVTADLDPDTGAARRLSGTHGLLVIMVFAALAGGWWWRPAPVATNTQTVATEPAQPAGTPAAIAAPTVPVPEAPVSQTTGDVAASGVTPAPAATPSEPVAASRAALEDIVSRAIVGVVMVDAAGSRGTGFFVAPDLIVTNAHVVGRDSAVTVRLHDGTTRMARVERTAPDLDLALLRAAAVPSSSVLQLGRAEAARVGQEVIAIGSALGLQGTVTRGILSATRQSGTVTLLQTDAAINPGNSGGPLLDRNGAVLGVTTLKVGGTAEGLGFAVSSAHVRAFIDGRVTATRDTRDAPVAAAMAPQLDGGLDASADGRRAAGTAAFERNLQQLAQHAAQIDAQWTRVEQTCRPDVASDGDRAWFALATQAARFSGTDPNCPYWLADLTTASRSFGDAMRAAAEEARRAGVYPGDQRARRRQWRLDWSGFDR